MFASKPQHKASRFLPPVGILLIFFSTLTTLALCLLLLDHAYDRSRPVSDEFKAVRNTLSTPSWVAGTLLAPVTTRVSAGARRTTQTPNIFIGRGSHGILDNPVVNSKPQAAVLKDSKRPAMHSPSQGSEPMQPAAGAHVPVARKDSTGSTPVLASKAQRPGAGSAPLTMSKTAPDPRDPKAPPLLAKPVQPKAAGTSPVAPAVVKPQVPSWWWEAQHEEMLGTPKPDNSILPADSKELGDIPDERQAEGLEFVIQGTVETPFALAPWVLRGQPLYPRWFNSPRNDTLRQELMKVGISPADSELFSRAAGAEEAARKVPLAVGSVQRIAFLFLTKGPLPLAPLWAKFFAGNEDLYSIYIHTRQGFQYRPGELPKCFEGRQTASKDAEWGTIDMVDAARRLLASAMIDPTNTRFVLVSESCIPLYNFTFIYNYLMARQDSFLAIKDEYGPSGRQRWSKGFLPLVQRWQWRKGGQWFQITRPVAEAVLRDVVFYSKFKEHCLVPKCVPDEHYLPTMLSVMGVARLARRDLTYTDWSQGGAHPREYGWGDVNMGTIKAMRNKANPGCKSTCYLFARKFRPMTRDPLLRLHQQIFL